MDMTEILICDDCLMVVAGVVETEDEEISAKRIADNWGEAYRLIPGNCEPDCYGFSSSPCDGCNSGYAGDRHQAYAVALVMVDGKWRDA